MTQLYEDQHVLIEHNENINCIEFKFKGYTPGQEQKKLLDKVLEFHKKYKCSCGLNDMREMKAIAPETQTFIETDWFPRMIQSGLKAFANINPAMGGGSMSAKKIDRELGDVKQATGIQVRFFDTAEQGRSWLASVK